MSLPQDTPKLLAKKNGASLRGAKQSRHADMPGKTPRHTAMPGNIDAWLSTTWWYWRGAYTRSHPELGRENPQRRWYCILRCGRVGRRQVFDTQTSSTPSQHHHPTMSAARPRLERQPRHPSSLRWSSPSEAVKIDNRAATDPAPSQNHRGVEQPGSSSGS